MGINIKEKATTLREDLRLYWKKPPMGRYMSFKEIVSLAVGGLGIQFVVFCAQNMIISIGNTLISNTIGIAPKPLYIIYILSVILSFPLTALRGKIIDSSRSKKDAIGRLFFQWVCRRRFLQSALSLCRMNVCRCLQNVSLFCFITSACSFSICSIMTLIKASSMFFRRTRSSAVT